MRRFILKHLEIMSYDNDLTWSSACPCNILSSTYLQAPRFQWPNKKHGYTVEIRSTHKDEEESLNHGGPRLSRGPPVNLHLLEPYLGSDYISVTNLSWSACPTTPPVSFTLSKQKVYTLSEQWPVLYLRFRPVIELVHSFVQTHTSHGISVVLFLQGSSLCCRITFVYISGYVCSNNYLNSMPKYY